MVQHLPSMHESLYCQQINRQNSIYHKDSVSLCEQKRCLYRSFYLNFHYLKKDLKILILLSPKICMYILVSMGVCTFIQMCGGPRLMSSAILDDCPPLSLIVKFIESATGWTMSFRIYLSSLLHSQLQACVTILGFS